jgi:hypothetical protein
MPQIVSPQTGNLAGGTDSSGNAMGAVIFDKPDNSGAEMLFHALQNNAKLLGDKEIAKKKQATTQALGMLHGLDLSKEGSHPNDIPEFSQRMSDFNDERAKLEQEYADNPTDPKRFEKLAEIRKRQKQYEIDLHQSAGQNAMAKSAILKLANDAKGEFDPQESMKNIDEYNAKSRADRDVYEKPLLVQTIKDLAIEGEPVIGKIKPTTTQFFGGVDANGHKYDVEQTIYTPTQIKEAGQMLMQGERTRKSVEKEFNNIDPSQQQKFIILADAETSTNQINDPNGKTVTPQELYARENYVRPRLSMKSEKNKTLKDSNANQLALYQGKRDILNGEDAFQFYQLQNFYNGAEGVVDDVKEIPVIQMNSGATNGTSITPMAGATITAQPIKTYAVSNARGMTLGVTDINVPKYDANGVAIPNAYQIVKQPEYIVNQIIQEVPDGKGGLKKVAMVATNKTIMDAGYGKPNQPTNLADPSIYRPFTQGDIQSAKKANGWKVNQTREYEKAGAYPEKIPNASKLTTGTTLPNMEKKAPNVNVEAPKVEAPKVEAPKVDATEQAKKDRINKIRVKAGLAPIK